MRHIGDAIVSTFAEVIDLIVKSISWVRFDTFVRTVRNR
jgi:hypothetical protein